jgi:hypothetical protein
MRFSFFIFFNSWGDLRLSPLCTSATNWSIVSAPDDRWWVWSSRWNKNWQGKQKCSEKTCPSTILFTTNPTWPDLGLNPGRRGGKPGTKRLSYGTANQVITFWGETRLQISKQNLHMSLFCVLSENKAWICTEFVHKKADSRYSYRCQLSSNCLYATASLPDSFYCTSLHSLQMCWRGPFYTQTSCKYGWTTAVSLNPQRICFNVRKRQHFEWKWISCHWFKSKSYKFLFWKRFRHKI